jgi:hypothetical protein
MSKEEEKEVRLIIAGGRHYVFTQEDIDRLNAIERIDCVVSGGCSGADKQGEIYAQKNGIPVDVFTADWKTHGRAAGPIRNRQMASYATHLAVFSGGSGTANMVKEALKAGLVIYDFRGER